MLAKCDKDIIALETRRGIYSLEYEEGQEKYIRSLDKNMKQYGITAPYIPARLKAIYQHIKKNVRRMQKRLKIKSKSYK